MESVRLVAAEDHNDSELLSKTFERVKQGKVCYELILERDAVMLESPEVLRQFLTEAVAENDFDVLYLSSQVGGNARLVNLASATKDRLAIARPALFGKEQRLAARPQAIHKEEDSNSGLIAGGVLLGLIVLVAIVYISRRNSRR